MMLDDLAKVAYEAYCRQSGFKSMVTGDRLPTWEQLGQSIRDCWRESARAVRDAVNEQWDGMTMS